MRNDQFRIKNWLFRFESSFGLDVVYRVEKIGAQLQPYDFYMRLMEDDCLDFLLCVVLGKTLMRKDIRIIYDEVNAQYYAAFNMSLMDDLSDSIKMLTSDNTYTKMNMFNNMYPISVGLVDSDDTIPINITQKGIIYMSKEDAVSHVCVIFSHFALPEHTVYTHEELYRDLYSDISMNFNKLFMVDDVHTYIKPSLQHQVKIFPINGALSFEVCTVFTLDTVNDTKIHRLTDRSIVFTGNDSIGNEVSEIKKGSLSSIISPLLSCGGLYGVIDEYTQITVDESTPYKKFKVDFKMEWFNLASSKVYFKNDDLIALTNKTFLPKTLLILHQKEHLETLDDIITKNSKFKKFKKIEHVGSNSTVNYYKLSI